MAAPIAVAPIPIPVAEAPIADEPLAAASPDQDSNNAEFVLGALLAALAAGGLGTMLVASRRRRARVAATPVVERPVVPRAVANPTVRPAATVAAPPAGTVRSSLAAAPLITGAVVNSAVAQPHQERAWKPLMASSAPTGGLAHAGAAIALPSTLPDSAAERRALLDRLVAAQPDRANPFRTPKARRHRARLIMQSIGRTFETGKSRIDLSQYPMNWPELAANRPAAA